MKEIRNKKKTAKRTKKLYMGYYADHSMPTIFWSSKTPTEDSHPGYSFVEGPFKNKGAAESRMRWMGYEPVGSFGNKTQSKRKTPKRIYVGYFTDHSTAEMIESRGAEKLSVSDLIIELNEAAEYLETKKKFETRILKKKVQDMVDAIDEAIFRLREGAKK